MCLDIQIDKYLDTRIGQRLFIRNRISELEGSACEIFLISSVFCMTKANGFSNVDKNGVGFLAVFESF